MKACVVIATKGRAKETGVLLDYLANQSVVPHFVVVAGSEPSDIAGLDTHPLITQQKGQLILSKAGLCTQRNAGVTALLAQPRLQDAQDWFVAFFDDDFRPAADWLAQALQYFQQEPTVVGLTGHVLADGVNLEFGIPESSANGYLTQQKAPRPHWSNVSSPQPLFGLYGCNMAYKAVVMQQQQFDENLPLYAWQEDYDFAHRALQYGELRLLPSCKGVHLGTSAGRTSGVRFGYSQIANPIYLVKKGSMPWRVAAKMMSKNLASNIVKSLTGVRIKDFPGRLKGNLRAISHLFTGKLNPLRVLDI